MSDLIRNRRLLLFIGVCPSLSLVDRLLKILVYPGSSW